MTMLDRLASFADATILAAGGGARRYAVHLVDRRTGLPHCIAGIPLTVFTRDPAEAGAEMMRNRDPHDWDILIERRTTREI